jgi:hypothetical protein
VKGRRVAVDARGFLPGEFKPGDYGRATNAELPDGHKYWTAMCPNGLRCNLARHDVIEHDDGTITVSPSILCTYEGGDGRREYHGYLERGVWRSA